MKHGRQYSWKSQQGSMLLEALIAVTIFSIGILGSIGLQAKVINNTLDARYRTDATFLANQIVSQMWVDPDTSTSPDSVNPTYACNPCTSINGNTATKAWVAEIQGTPSTPGFLPGVTDTANQPSISISTNQVTVTVNWMGPDGTPHTYSTTTEMHFNN